MTLFTALEALEELKTAYHENADLHRIFEDFESRIKTAETADNYLSLLSIINDLKDTFPDDANRSYFSPKLWLPFHAYFFPQKMYVIVSSLEACLQKGRSPAANGLSILNLPFLKSHNAGDIRAFGLPSIKSPMFADEEIENKFSQTKEALAELTNEQTPEYMYQKWHEFYRATQLEKQLEQHHQRSWWQKRHMQHYFETRQGIQNQLAFAYLFNQHKKASMNYTSDWRHGNSQQTGYGYVMALALPNYDLPSIHQGALNAYKAEMAAFEQNRFDSTLDQNEIKHNRLTSLMVATTKSRAHAILELAKENPDQHLNIKLLSRWNAERFSYLKYDASDSHNKIIFCDPRYGLFQFEDDADFLFFYQTLYAKEQHQTDTCWNRYQVSSMRYAPNETPTYTWLGKFRSLFSGLKYNSGVVARIQNFVLFNATLFIYIVAAYMITGAISVLSPFVGTLMLLLLAQNNGSMFVSSMFTFGSSGLRSAPDFLYAMFLSVSDVCKSLLGLRPSYDETLHTSFDLQERNLERAGTFGVLFKTLNIHPIHIPPISIPPLNLPDFTVNIEEINQRTQADTQSHLEVLLREQQARDNHPLTRIITEFDSPTMN